jgi:hypothetical protein
VIRRNLALTLFAGLLGVVLLGGRANAEASCTDLSQAALAGGHVDSAVAVPGGGPITLVASQPGLPAPMAFCRVKATLTPTPSSDIRIEVWLPARAAWNGKLLGAGNGGYGGGFLGPFLTMRPALAKGYVAAGTNMGHVSEGDIDASWALGHPEKVKDFGGRANHLTADAAKALIAAYYGSSPTHAYFQGCSDGGREALMEAEKFPGDYDGVIAGAPANAWTHLMTAFAWDELASRGPHASPIPDAKLAMIQAAALSQCSALDPLKDGYFGDPRACHFKPEALRCKAGDAPNCLTEGQIAALHKIYDGPTDPKTHAHLFPGYTPGAEAQPGTWSVWITGAKGQHGRFATAFYKDMVFGDPTWSLADFKLHEDLARAQRNLGPVLDSDNPNLRAFAARGGKLILYHGWSDAAVPPQATVAYYGRVRAALGETTSDAMVRLFMVPGMGHCLTGPGPNTFDTLAALEGWTEHGAAPRSIVARKYGNDLMAYLGMPAGPMSKSRPLCPYPQTARWSGKGSANDAANFACERPKPVR